MIVIHDDYKDGDGNHQDFRWNLAEQMINNPYLNENRGRT
jgi:hypothetical protein